MFVREGGYDPVTMGEFVLRTLAASIGPESGHRSEVSQRGLIQGTPLSAGSMALPRM